MKVFDPPNIRSNRSISSLGIFILLSFRSWINYSFFISFDISFWCCLSRSITSTSLVLALVLIVRRMLLPDTYRGMWLKSPLKREWRYTSSQLNLDLLGSSTFLPSFSISTLSFSLRQPSMNYTINEGTSFCSSVFRTLSKFMMFCLIVHFAWLGVFPTRSWKKIQPIA